MYCMPKVPYDYLQRWCQEHGWTDLFVDQCQFWAFPPGAVLPLPIPAYAFEGFQVGSPSRRSWIFNGVAIACTVAGIVLTAFTFSPMPLLIAFAVSVTAVALVDDHF
jgi:hypothetical protein